LEEKYPSPPLVTPPEKATVYASCLQISFIIWRYIKCMKSSFLVHGFEFFGKCMVM
jgi:hypothetical protein